MSSKLPLLLACLLLVDLSLSCQHGCQSQTHSQHSSKPLQQSKSSWKLQKKWQEKHLPRKFPPGFIIAQCPDPRLVKCGTMYEPVCGYFKDGTHQTYTNLCQACINLIYGYTKGQCPSPAPKCPPKPPACVPNPRAICPLFFKPLCGTSPEGVRTTYSNTCFATAACATDIVDGVCPARECPPSFVKCAAVYEPVCGTDVKGALQTFPNTCVANKLCAIDITKGPCAGTSLCTREFTKTCDPKVQTLVATCGVKLDGTANVYSNECLACRDGAVTYRSPAGDCKNPFILV